MARYPRNPASARARRRGRFARTVAMVLALSLGTALPLLAQSEARSSIRRNSAEVHYRFDGTEPPGAIGRERLARGGPLPGYFQPVEIRAATGVQVALAVEGTFAEPQTVPVTVGLLIAPVYRLRVSNIANHEGQEVFPTIEVIDRLYPPAGQRRRFPIPIELTTEDLELALDGRFVTRVVYLEEPELALPVAEGRGEQDWYDVGPGVNPLEEADRLGRPMAILRMGGRMPDFQDGPEPSFMHGSPPFTLFRPRAGAEADADADAKALFPRSARRRAPGAGGPQRR